MYENADEYSEIPIKCAGIDTSKWLASALFDCIDK